jgi:hypothetical protein
LSNIELAVVSLDAYLSTLETNYELDTYMVSYAYNKVYIEQKNGIEIAYLRVELYHPVGLSMCSKASGGLCVHATNLLLTQ